MPDGHGADKNKRPGQVVNQGQEGINARPALEGGYLPPQQRQALLLIPSRGRLGYIGIISPHRVSDVPFVGIVRGVVEKPKDDQGAQCWLMWHPALGGGWVAASAKLRPPSYSQPGAAGLHGLAPKPFVFVLGPAEAFSDRVCTHVGNLGGDGLVATQDVVECGTLALGGG